MSTRHALVRKTEKCRAMPTHSGTERQNSNSCTAIFQILHLSANKDTDPGHSSRKRHSMPNPAATPQQRRRRAAAPPHFARTAAHRILSDLHPNLHHRIRRIRRLILEFYTEAQRICPVLFERRCIPYREPFISIAEEVS